MTDPRDIEERIADIERELFWLMVGVLAALVIAAATGCWIGWKLTEWWGLAC